MLVKYEQIDNEWRCTCLVFDIIGTGDTREAALAETVSLVEDMADAIVNSQRPVHVDNPSEPKDWINADDEPVDVACWAQGKAKDRWKSTAK